MKKSPFPASGERDAETEFSSFFPSRRRNDFDRNGPEASVLRIFYCLPADYISPEFFSRILGRDFPLTETLDKLAEKGIIKKDEKNGSYLLCYEAGMEGLSSSKEGMALISLISAEIEKEKKQGNFASLRDWLELGRSVIKKFDEEIKSAGKSGVNSGGNFRCGISAEEFPQSSGGAETAASILNSSVLFCNVIVTGKDVSIGLKYDEENMFAPMIIFLEKGASAAAIVWAAGNLGVPVVKNNLLAKNLFQYGKAGSSVPEATYRDVSLALTRSNLPERKRPLRSLTKTRRIPYKVPPPVSLEMGESLFALTGEGPGRKALIADPFEAIRKRIVRLLGFDIPHFRMSKNPELKAGEYRIFFNGMEAGRGRMELGWYTGLSALHMKAGLPEIMAKAENLIPAAKAAASVVIRHVDEIAQRRAPDLLGRDEVDAILEAAEENYPVVCAEVKSILSLGIIREILQGLVSEQVSIRHIAVILETLADWSSFGPAPVEVIIEQIRISLKRQICMEYADDELTLRVLTLEPDLENRLSGDFPETDNWAGPVSSALSEMEKKGYPPVILCSSRARYPLKEATRKKFPFLAVLSYVEIPSDIRVEPLGEIRLPGRSG